MYKRKTKRMLLCEEQNGIKLEDELPKRLNELGLSRTADSLGVSKATLGYWLLKMGIEVRRIAVSPGEKVEVTRSG